MHVITVLVLFLILKKFFFEKVHDFIVNRENAVKSAFDSADAINKKADERLNAYTKKLADIEAESREIIKNAKTKAENQANNILEEAQKKADDMISKARNDIEREKVQALADMKNQIVSFAIMAAEKIIEKDIEAEGQNVLIDKIIEEAGRTGWRN